MILIHVFVIFISHFWVPILCPAWSYWLSLSAASISFFRSHLVPDIIEHKTGLPFYEICHLTVLRHFGNFDKFTLWVSNQSSFSLFLSQADSSPGNSDKHFFSESSPLLMTLPDSQIPLCVTLLMSVNSYARHYCCCQSTLCDKTYRPLSESHGLPPVHSDNSDSVASAAEIWKFLIMISWQDSHNDLTNELPNESSSRSI